MNIIIKRRQIENINFYKEPDATLYPVSKINLNDLLLKEFTWRNKSHIENIIQIKWRNIICFKCQKKIKAASRIDKNTHLC